MNTEGTTLKVGVKPKPGTKSYKQPLKNKISASKIEMEALAFDEQLQSPFKAARSEHRVNTNRVPQSSRNTTLTAVDRLGTQQKSA